MRSRERAESCGSHGINEEETEAFKELARGYELIDEAQAAIMLAREVEGKIRSFSEASSRLSCLQSVLNKQGWKLVRADEVWADKSDAKQPHAAAKRELGNGSTLLAYHWWTPHS